MTRDERAWIGGRGQGSFIIDRVQAHAGSDRTTHARCRWGNAVSITNSTRKFMVCLVAALMALPIVAVPALADTAPTPTSVTIQVALDLDCSSVPNTPEARKVLRENELCGYSKSGGIAPDITVIGDCGSLSLNLFNSGGGWMQWKEEMTSSLGPFVAAGYTGSWDNFNGGQGPVSRSFVGLTSDWLDIFGIHTGAGHVVGQINGAWDRLWWGGLCTNTAVLGTSVNVT